MNVKMNKTILQTLKRKQVKKRKAYSTRIFSGFFTWLMSFIQICIIYVKIFKIMSPIRIVKCIKKKTRLILFDTQNNK